MLTQSQHKFLYKREKNKKKTKTKNIIRNSSTNLFKHETIPRNKNNFENKINKLTYVVVQKRP